MTLLAEYQYDVGHRRMGRTTRTDEDRWGTLAAHDFIHDDWQVIEQRLRGWAGPERQFVYGAFIDEPLVMDVNENFDATCTGAGDSRYFYHQDRIYSVVGLTDAAGTIVEAYEYDPYGRRYVFNDGDADGAVEFDGSDTVTLDAASAFGNPYVFTGRRWEDETGLHYYRRRWYDAPRARFLSRDPIGFGDGPHLYQYAHCKVLTLTDPLGLDAGITADSETAIHTGIAVEVLYEGRNVGYLTADFAAKGYTPNEGSSGDLEDLIDNISVEGELSITFTPKEMEDVIRKVEGNLNQDHILINWILEQIGKDKRWLKEKTNNYCKNYTVKLDTVGLFDSYRVLSQNCNDFTNAALDTYLGFDWTDELFYTGEDLIELWDGRNKENDEE